MRRALIVLAVLAVLAGGAAWAFRQLGRWLVVQDALEPARAIVVLSGSMPVRARQAAAIYHQDFAAEVWVMRPLSAAEELKEMGIFYVGEEFYNQKVLIHLGVPSDAIRVLEKPVLNTEDEVRQISEQLQSEGGQKVIVVTSKPHTRRVKTIWKALVGESPRVLVRYAADDDFDAAHWWRSTREALDVVREVLGLVNAWSGFPVRPAAR